MSIEENIIKMHHECAMRNNASSEVIKAMAQLGKEFGDAVAAALLTTGGIHAPVKEAQEEFSIFRNNDRLSEDIDKVPGFGSAWYKNQPDPVIEDFFNTLPDTCDEGAELVATVEEYTDAVQRMYERFIYPNAGLATAVANIALKRPSNMAMGLVIQGRISAWEELYIANYKYRGF